MQPNDQPPVMPPQKTPPVAPVMPEPQQQAEMVQEQVKTPSELPQIQPVVWQDIEYIQHDKTPLWYIGFLLVVVVLIAAAVLLQAWTFIPLIIVMAVALMIYTHRPARLLSYTWSSKGLTINDQLHPTGEFRSFGVTRDETHNALVFIPVKRFRPGLTVYFPSEIGEELVDAVGAYLPIQDVHPDAFDKIIRKLRI